MLFRVLSVVLAWGLASAAPGNRSGEVRVLLWGTTPEVAAELAAGPVGPLKLDGRFESVDRAEFGAALDRARAQAQAQAREGLAAVEVGLAAARDHYLAQHWDAMVAGLEQLEAEHLTLLADPRHCDALWETEFRLGLARAGDKPTPEARRRYLFALALAPERRPAREVYGPAVVAGFLEAVDAQNGHVAAPVSLDVQPPHAVVHVDCQPVHTSHVDLRPGLHVIHARAMGHHSTAVLFEVPEATRVAISLVEDVDGDPVVRLGRSLAAGPLVLAMPSHRRALVEAAAARDIAVVVVVEPAADAVMARALVGEGRGPAVRRTGINAAIDAALASVADDGTLRGPVAASPARSSSEPTPPARKPIVRAWWLWTGIAVVVATGLGLGLGLGLSKPESDRLIIYGPR